MLDALKDLPWGMIGVGYVGLIVYVFTSLADPSDESLASISDVVKKKGRTVLTAAVTVPVLILGAKEYGELTSLAAFCAGYMNLSIIRKATDGWAARSKLAGGN
jgi:hypothetical protein